MDDVFRDKNGVLTSFFQGKMNTHDQFSTKVNLVSLCDPMQFRKLSFAQTYKNVILSIGAHFPWFLLSRFCPVHIDNLFKLKPFFTLNFKHFFVDLETDFQWAAAKELFFKSVEFYCETSSLIGVKKAMNVRIYSSVGDLEKNQ